ncbi:glycosyltransferase family 1 protein [Pseudaeromonas sp. ZJS20]|uniref:glycosyltransferase family 4 protein n=1 Tax=Pseudaeromonas aegiceratis TaxID=3153928 RepID=UPI00390CA8C7
MSIFINDRIIQSGKLTGVHRYLHSIMAEFPSGSFSTIHPQFFSAGAKGHFWEQVILPRMLSHNLNEDVLWSPSNTGPITKLKCKHVVTIHDVAAIEHPEWVTKGFGLLYRHITPRLISNCDAVIAVSEYTKQRLMDLYGLNDDKVHVIHNGVDERFKYSSCDAAERSLLRQKYGISTDKFILTLSSIEPRKNIGRLLAAWEQISSGFSDVTFVIAGVRNDKIFSDIGIDRVPENVHFTGYIDDADIVKLYQSSAGFVYAPLYEGFGLPPLEAMSCGVPVITSNTTSLPEVVGDAALMVEPTDINDISSAMSNLLNDSMLAHRLSTAGLKQAKKFSWGKCASATYNVLANI